MTPALFAIGNHKGGVGKTTLALNIAAAFGASGHRTLLIDSDPTWRASQVLGVDPRTTQATLADVYLGRHEPSSAIVDDVMPNVDLLPSSLELRDVDLSLVGAAHRELRLRVVLGPYLD